MTTKTNTFNYRGIFAHAVGRLVLFAGAGFSAIVVVPTLSILSFVFSVVGLGILVVPFLNLFWGVGIPFYVLSFPVTGLVQILVGMITGAALMAAGLMCGRGLKLYFKCVKYILR